MQEELLIASQARRSVLADRVSGCRIQLHCGLDQRLFEQARILRP